MKSAKPNEEHVSVPTVQELEKACDLTVIEYFEALLEQRKLTDRLNYLEKVSLPALLHRFEEAKVEHLRAKHGMTKPVPEPE